MTASLPIVGHDKPCLIDPDMLPWLVDKTLRLDEEGVYYVIDDQRYYVHDQVMVIAVKQGLKPPLTPKMRMRNYVRARADPDVRRYYNSRDV